MKQIKAECMDGHKILVGENAGKEARRQMYLDDFEDEDEVIILIPKGIWGMGESFFKGLFKKDIKLLKHNFWDKYKFKNYDGGKIECFLFENLKKNHQYIMDEIKKEENMAEKKCVINETVCFN